MCFAEFNSASALRFHWPDSWCPRVAALGCPPRVVVHLAASAMVICASHGLQTRDHSLGNRRPFRLLSLSLRIENDDVTGVCRGASEPRKEQPPPSSHRVARDPLEAPGGRWQIREMATPCSVDAWLQLNRHFFEKFFHSVWSRHQTRRPR